MSVSKIFRLDELARRLEVSRQAGLKIVQCHGCFDLMHIGHIRHLQAARAMGDLLVVTVTADLYVAKGDGRPAFAEALRAEALAALACVDRVAISPGADGGRGDPAAQAGFLRQGSGRRGARSAQRRAPAGDRGGRKRWAASRASRTKRYSPPRRC